VSETDTPQPTKLCMIIVSDRDAGRLIDKLVRAGIPSTKLGSTGGFLRRGNATIITGVPDTDVDRTLAIVRDVCHVRTELLPIQSLPFIGDGGYLSDPVEVRAGGATVFVLNIERFERS